MALAVYPELMNSPDFPADAKDRAQRVLGSCRGNSVGTSFCQRWLPLVGCLNWLFLVGVNYQYQNQNTVYNTGVRHNIWLTVFSEKKLYKKQNFFFQLPEYHSWSIMMKPKLNWMSGCTSTTFIKHIIWIALSVWQPNNQPVLILWHVIAGAYSDSAGVSIIRQDIAKFISDRDGHPANQNHVFLSTGASDGIKVMCDSTCSLLNRTARSFPFLCSSECKDYKSLHKVQKMQCVIELHVQLCPSSRNSILVSESMLSHLVIFHSRLWGII